MQVLQQGIRRRKDSDPTSKGETFQMSHLSQETVHWTWTVNTLHAGMCVCHSFGTRLARPRPTRTRFF